MRRIAVGRQVAGKRLGTLDEIGTLVVESAHEVHQLAVHGVHLDRRVVHRPHHDVGGHLRGLPHVGIDAVENRAQGLVVVADGRHEVGKEAHGVGHNLVGRHPEHESDKTGKEVEHQVHLELRHDADAVEVVAQEEVQPGGGGKQTAVVEAEMPLGEPFVPGGHGVDGRE